jgi:hypothetical protein
MHDLIPVRDKSFLPVLESFEIGYGSHCLLVALFPKVRRPGRGADYISICCGFKNVWGFTFA